MLRRTGLALVVLGVAPAEAQDFTIVTLAPDELDAVLHYDPFANLPGGLPSAFEIDAESIEGVAVITATVGYWHEAEALAVQAAIGNVVNEAEVHYSNAIVDSGNGNRGIVTVKQATGSLNNQASVHAGAVGVGGEGADLQIADVWGVQVLGANSVTSEGGSYDNTISNSFNGGRGLAAVQQAAGTLNLQAGAVAFAVGVSYGPELVALADCALARVKGDNEFLVDDTALRENTLEGSFNDFAGVAQVSQAAGHGNVIGQGIGLTASVRSLP